MKKLIYTLFMMVAVTLLPSCEKDNYDGPDVMLTGAIMYQGDTLFLKNGEVSLQLYEPGWATSSSTYVTVYVDQFGKFSSNIFGGKTYKMIRSTIGAWELPTASDTITFTANGNTVQNIEVKPYFLIKNTDIHVSDNVVTANFDIQEIVGNSHIEYAQLCLFQNAIIDISNNDVETSNGNNTINGKLNTVQIGTNTITKTIVENNLLKYNFIFARVGIKVQGASALLYSSPVKLYLK